MSFTPQQCSKAQREELDRRMRVSRMSYRDLLQICAKIADRNITDVGQLTKWEASQIIDDLQAD